MRDRYISIRSAGMKGYQHYYLIKMLSEVQKKNKKIKNIKYKMT